LINVGQLHRDGVTDEWRYSQKTTHH